ncbi:hypothetical protein JXA47_08155 [Candidatus Sumerlaeota bacterium]|nr:hypothetical protein [Candidatus Sumerlaeota bacterium]
MRPKEITPVEEGPAETHVFAIPLLWRWLALLLLGVAVLVAYVGGDQPPLFNREMAGLACTGLALVSILATLRRPSAVATLSLFDGLLLVALSTAAVAAFHSPLRPPAITALLWQASLVGVFLAGRLIGPAISGPALALWSTATAGLGALWAVRDTAALPAQCRAVAAHLDSLTLLEWALALGLIAACWLRQAWARRQPARSLRYLRRALLFLLTLSAAGLHLMAMAGSDLEGFLSRRAAGWSVGRALFWEWPLWGWGGGTWQWSLQSLQSPPVIDEPIAQTTAVWVLTAGGISALVICTVLITGLLGTLAGARRPDKPSRVGTPLMSVGAIALAWGLMGLWSLTPVRPCNLIITAFLLGTSLSIDLREITSESRGPSVLRGVLWACALLTGMLLLIALALSPALSWWVRAASDETSALARIRAAEHLNPWNDLWPRREAQILGLQIWRDPTSDGEGRWHRFLAAHTRARRLNPCETESWVSPANAVLKLRGDAEQAESLYRQGLDHIPLDREMRLALASLLEQRGDHAGAFNTLRPLDRIHPTSQSKVVLAMLAWRLGDRDLAERFALEAIQLGNRSGALRALLLEMNSPLLDVLS